MPMCRRRRGRTFIVWRDVTTAPTVGRFETRDSRQREACRQPLRAPSSDGEGIGGRTVFVSHPRDGAALGGPSGPTGSGRVRAALEHDEHRRPMRRRATSSEGARSRCGGRSVSKESGPRAVRRPPRGVSVRAVGEPSWAREAPSLGVARVRTRRGEACGVGPQAMPRRGSRGHG